MLPLSFPLEIQTASSCMVSKASWWFKRPSAMMFSYQYKTLAGGFFMFIPPVFQGTVLQTYQSKIMVTIVHASGF